MGYKCTPQVIGLVRGEPKQGARHRANGKAILEELGNERYSKSVTLDRSRSTSNEYQGYASGGKCWDAMSVKADAYRIKGKTKNGKDYERGLRSDAVIGWAMIINPSDEMSQGWTQEQYQKFYRDSFAALHKIQPDLFRAANITMTSTHRDEGLLGADGRYGEHMHIAGHAIDEQGRYCGNKIDAKLVCDINKQYPALMRARGWDLEDIEVTDWARMGKDKDGNDIDPEYKASRRKKRAGRSVNQYVADKAKDADNAYTDAMEQLQAAQAQAVAVVAEAEERADIIDEASARKGAGLFGAKKGLELELARKVQAVDQRQRDLEQQAAQQAEEYADAVRQLSNRENSIKRRERLCKAREGALDQRAKELDVEVERRALEFSRPIIDRCNRELGAAETRRILEGMKRGFGKTDEPEREDELSK